MNIEKVEQFRASLRSMVRELGMLNKKSSGTNLSPLQSHILIELNKAPLGVTELSKILYAEKSSISRTISNLEKSNILYRRQDKTDGRTAKFYLTELGTKTLSTINNYSNSFISDAIEIASEDEIRIISSSIESLTKILETRRKQRELNFVIRPITPDDNNSIAKVIRKSFKDNKIDHLDGVSLHDSDLLNIFDSYQSKKSGYWVIVVNKIIVGGVGITHLIGEDGDYCEMQKMYLDKSILGMGFGRLLVSLSLNHAKELGYKYCYLETLDELESAVSLYKSFGFKRINNRLGNTGHKSCKVYMLKALQ